MGTSKVAVSVGQGARGMGIKERDAENVERHSGAVQQIHKRSDGEAEFQWWWMWCLSEITEIVALVESIWTEKPNGGRVRATVRAKVKRTRQRFGHLAKVFVALVASVSVVAEATWAKGVEETVGGSGGVVCKVLDMGDTKDAQRMAVGD